MKVFELLESDWENQPITRANLNNKQRSACLHFMIYLQFLTNKYPEWVLSPLRGPSMASQLSWLENTGSSKYLFKVLPTWSEGLAKIATKQEIKTYDIKISRVLHAKAAAKGKIK